MHSLSNSAHWLSCFHHCQDHGIVHARGVLLPHNCINMRLALPGSFAHELGIFSKTPGG